MLLKLISVVDFCSTNMDMLCEQGVDLLLRDKVSVERAKE